MITNYVRLKYREDSPLDGAFTYLQKTFKREDINNDIVKIETSYNGQNYESPVIKRNIGSDNAWFSENKNGSWYEVDFLQNNFYLESYVMRAYYQDFFEKWQVLGSNDGTHFDVIDDVTGFQRPKVYEYHNVYRKCKYPRTRRIFIALATSLSTLQKR